MDVTLDATLSVNISVNTGTSFSDSTHMTIGATANALVALVSWGFHSADNPPAGRSITWNGVAMTLVPGTSVTDTNGDTTEVYALLNPATGTHAFAGSWTNTHDCLATCLSYIGADTSFSNAFVGASTSFASSSAPTVSVASTANSLVAGIDASNTLSFTSTSGTTIYNVNTLPSVTGVAMRDTGAAPTKSVSAVSNASTDVHAISIVSVNPPLPFPAADFSRPHGVVSGQAPQFKNLAITVAPSTNAFARPPLFSKPFDIPGIIWQALGSPQALLAGAPPAAPFYTQDFSKPFFPQIASTSIQGTNLNLFKNPIPILNPFIQPPALFGPSAAHPFQTATLTLTANLGPWTQTDFSKPSAYLPNPALAVAGTNVNLFPNPIPFGPYDWSKPAQPYRPQPRVEGVNLNLFTIQAPPIIPPDLSYSRFAYPYRPDASRPTNPNLFTNPIPVYPPDLSSSRFPPPAAPSAPLPSPLALSANLGPFTQQQPPAAWTCPAAPAITLPSNIALLTATQAPPFVPVDFSKPFFPSVRTDNSQPSPFALLNTDTTTTLRVQYLSKPKQPYVTPPDPYQSVVSIALLTVPVGAPVIPYDFSKPYFPSVATDKTQPTNINLFSNPIPFYPVDLSKPFFPGGAPAVALPVNPNLYSVSATAVPFVQTDWPRPYVNPAIPAETYSLLFFPAPPIIPTDTSYVSRPAPSLAHPYTLNIALTSVVVPAPFVAIDWSKPFFPRPGAVDPAFGSANPNLFTNPIPFFNSMDFRSPARPQWRTWDQGPPNMVLLITPPPPPPVSTEQPPYFFNLSFGKMSGF